MSSLFDDAASFALLVESVRYAQTQVLTAALRADSLSLRSGPSEAVVPREPDGMVWLESKHPEYDVLRRLVEAFEVTSTKRLTSGLSLLLRGLEVELRCVHAAVLEAVVGMTVSR